jgi:hypothetical protein
MYACMCVCMHAKEEGKHLVVWQRPASLGKPNSGRGHHPPLCLQLVYVVAPDYLCRVCVCVQGVSKCPAKQEALGLGYIYIYVYIHIYKVSSKVSMLHLGV